MMAAASLRAQDGTSPKSALTGATLIPGTKLEKGFFIRMAAKASMDMNAQDVRQSLSDEYEVYKLPAALGLGAVASMQAALEGQGWRVTFESTKSPETEKWGWMSRAEAPAQRFLVFYLLDKKQSYLYLAKAGGAEGATAAPRETMATATPFPTSVPNRTPSPGTPTTSTASIFAPAPVSIPAPAPRPSTAPNAGPKRWTFVTTNFNDGWQAFDEPEWVRGAKGSVTARVHHATFDLRPYVNQDGTIYVWNQLIVPRYRDLSNVWVRKSWWEDADKNYVSAEGTEIASGRRYFLVLFRNGNGNHWIEYLAPDKATFEREMQVTVQVQGGTNWAALVRDGLNKFAVSAADLPGDWGSSSAAGIEYVSAITGNSLGIGAVSSDHKFVFRNDGTYEMRYVGASGMAGNQKFGGENWAGRATITSPWTMSLTGTFKGQTYDFDVWFEVVKGGGRILVLRRNNDDIRLLRSSQ